MNISCNKPSEISQRRNWRYCQTQDTLCRFRKLKEYGKSSIEGITFLTIDKEDMVAVRETLNPRYELDDAVHGTRSCHHFFLTSQYIAQVCLMHICKNVLSDMLLIRPK